MNQTDKILALIARHTPHAKARLARICKKHPAQVTRYVRSGEVPVENYPALMEWAEARGLRDEMLKIIGISVDGIYIRASRW